MSLPKARISYPSVLTGKKNGMLPDSILLDTPGQAGGPTVRLVEPAARAWRALTAAALKDGHVLRASSLMDSYRPYAVQERIFRERYSTTYRRGASRRLWQGRYWYQRPGTAAAAVPGSSNHGLALAVDCGEERDQDPGGESFDRDTLNWMLANAAKFGWSWELDSEPWHIRYVAGDKIPSAVLLYEADEHDRQEEEYDDMIAGYDKSPEDVARATIRELCEEWWGPDQMTTKDQNWLLGEWAKKGREHMMTLLLDHPKAHHK